MTYEDDEDDLQDILDNAIWFEDAEDGPDDGPWIPNPEDIEQLRKDIEENMKAFTVKDIEDFVIYSVDLVDAPLHPEWRIFPA